MTHEPRDPERELRELFRAARSADAERAPSFAAMTRPPRAAAPARPRLRRLAFVGAATAIVATAIALPMVWLVAPPTGPGTEAPPLVARGNVDRPRVERVAHPVVVESSARPAPALVEPGGTVGAPTPTREPAPEATPAAPPAPSPIDLRHLETLGAVADAAPKQERQSDEFVQDLPERGRFYQNVLTLAPGVSEADKDSGAEVQRSRARDFKAVVGGVSNVDPLTGQATSGVNATEIEERVLVSGRAAVFDLGRRAKVVAAPPPIDPRIGNEPGNTESYEPLRENEFLAVTENPLSTFSIDVDTASYANLRRFLTSGQLPPRDAVRIEELINYFDYDYAPPSDDTPFAASVEVAACPWNPEHRLARIGLKGREIARGAHPGSNLVFLIDVSGSMATPAKLPLLKSALGLLVEQLTARDRVAIVVYAGASGLALPSTSGDAKDEILATIERLEAGGSTNGGAGLLLAYRIARENFVPGGVNRVILATDGDFNVGVTDRGELLRAIETDAKKGIFLTTLGFGYGNLKDDRLEQLADKGNGNYAYIDRLAEARKVLVEEMTGTLVTIAKDVKIQVEFNPLEVGAYRLIGYENRVLKKEDFNDDRKDAGEIGAGHTVTALYELAPPARAAVAAPVDPLKYQAAPAPTRAAEGGELFTLRLRYKDPEADASRLLSFPVVDEGLGLDAASPDFKFAAAVAETGLLLRGSSLAGAATFDAAEKLAAEGLGPDERGLRAEFLQLLRTAHALQGERQGS